MGPRSLLREGIERKYGTCQEAAREINITNSMMSKMLAGERNIASDIKPKLASMHPYAGLAIAEEVTGYNCFSYIEGDRHPQAMIRRVEKEDKEADEAVKKLPYLILDKNGHEDLTDEERQTLFAQSKEIIDRVCADLNLIAELEDRYRLGILDYLIGKKEKALGSVAETRTIYKTT